MEKNRFSNVDEYINSFPKELTPLLRQIRQVIKQAAPQADEAISYGMPAYKLKGKPLVYFAAFKNHIGVNATPPGHAEFPKDLAHYKQRKGSDQFP